MKIKRVGPIATLKSIKEDQKKVYAAEWRKKNADYQRKYYRKKKILKLLADYDNDWDMDETELIKRLEALFKA